MPDDSAAGRRFAFPRIGWRFAFIAGAAALALGFALRRFAGFAWRRLIASATTIDVVQFRAG